MSQSLLVSFFLALFLFSNNLHAITATPSVAEAPASYQITWSAATVCTGGNFRIDEYRQGTTNRISRRYTSSQNIWYGQSSAATYTYKIYRATCAPTGEGYFYLGAVNVTLTTAENGDVDYQYDALGRLIHVADPINGDRHFYYDAAGNRTNLATD